MDCANPVVDFHGKFLLCSHSLAADLAIPADQVVDIVNVGLGAAKGDGLSHLAEIANYEHLQSAVKRLEEPLPRNIKSLFEEGQLLLDIYTCYPIVPIACLGALGLATTTKGLREFIDEHEITQTGGMNLARGAWNNPALNGLIAMYESLVEQRVEVRPHGLVHGNGGLGYRQGLVLMR